MTIYEPMTEKIMVGKGYNQVVGRIYCWERTELPSTYRTDNMADLIKSLRRLNIDPSQIDNDGTENPFKTERLPNEQFDALYYSVAKPIIRILKRNIPGIKANSEINLSHPFLLEIRNYKSYQFKLEEVPEILKDTKCTIEDLLFHKEVEEGIAPLSRLETLYILMKSGLLPPLTEIF